MLSQSSEHHQTNLFGSDLLLQLDPNDPLLQLSDVIPWHDFEQEFSKYYTKNIGAPSKPIRLMVGLLLLKSLRNLSDESVVLQWKENVYYQTFCGMTEFQQSVPCHATELVHFRKRIGKDGFQKILKAVCDRGYRGKKMVNETEIILPSKGLKKDNRYQRDKKRKQCQRRAAIEPIIGHLKSDFKLSRNFLKGEVGDEINLLMAATAWNLKKWLNLFFVLHFIAKLFRQNLIIIGLRRKVDRITSFHALNHCINRLRYIIRSFGAFFKG